MDPTGTLAIGSIDIAIEEVEQIRHLHNQYIINDCVYHLKKAREALSEGLETPVNWNGILRLLALFVLQKKSLSIVNDDQFETIQLGDQIS